MRHPAHGFLQRILLVGVLATGLSLSGCGLKGPLYRPGERQQQGTPSASPAGGKPPMSDRQPAPQAQKNDPSAPSDSAPVVDPDRPANPAPGTP